LLFTWNCLSASRTQSEVLSSLIVQKKVRAETTYREQIGSFRFGAGLGKSATQALGIDRLGF